MVHTGAWGLDLQGTKMPLAMARATHLANFREHIAGDTRVVDLGNIHLAQVPRDGELLAHRRNRTPRPTPISTFRGALYV
jgi:hypothetical protein